MILAILLLAAAAGGSLPPCPAAQLSLSFDDEDGTFSGMQQSGTLMVVRNLGPGDCTVPSLPTLTFFNAKGKPLAVVRKAPPHMHPGPVMAPAGVADGAEVTAILNWVSGPAFEHSRCIDTTSARISIGSDILSGEVGTTFCAPQDAVATFDQPPLRPDPVLGRRGTRNAPSWPGRPIMDHGPRVGPGLLSSVHRHRLDRQSTIKRNDHAAP